MPVVHTDCPIGPAEILAGGRWSRLVPPGDPAAMAEAIRATLAAGASPADPLAWERFRLDVVSTRWAELLAAAAGDGRHRPLERPGART